MSLSKDLVGKEFPSFYYEVSREKIKEFLRALNETKEVYWDKEKAKEAGFSDTPAPPTFSTAILFHGNPNFFSDIASIGVDIKRLLHMKEEYTYHEPIYPGMTVHCQSQVIDVKTGKMDMLTTKGTMHDQDGNLCMEMEMAIVIRPE